MAFLRALIVLIVFAAAASAEEIPFAELLRQAQDKTKGRKPAETAAIWDCVVAANPTNADFWHELAKARHDGKEYRLAIPAFEKVLELRAGYPANAAYKLACCHAQLGEIEPALRWLEKAMQLGFRYPQQAHTDADLARLREIPRFQELVYLTDVKSLSRDAGWRYDLDLLAKELKRLHYSPFRIVTREEFDARVRKLHDAIPKLGDDAILVEMMKLTRLVNDGHTHIRPAEPRAVPLQLFEFTEGIFVTAAAPEHADLAGAQVLQVAGRPVADVLAAVEPTISRDNAMGVKAVAARRIGVPQILHGLGLTSEADHLSMTVRDAAGKERSVTLQASTAKPNEKWATPRRDASRPVPLYLKNRQKPYWFETLPAERLVYFQYNAIREGIGESFSDFCDRLFKAVVVPEVDRLVIDLRWNGGGNTFLVRPLLHGLIRCVKARERGRLFVIIGRNTFSAAQNTTTDIDLHTEALFVGEPTGSSPNFIGETINFTLPYSKLTGSISDLYWGRSWPMDYRTWIAPDIYSPPSFALYRDNRDPALEAILAYK